MSSAKLTEKWGFRRILPGIAALSAALVVCLLSSQHHTVKAGTEADEAATARHVFSEKVAAKYNFRYGKAFPFLPSYATTDTGEFISPKSFYTADYCGHCHQEAHQQWRESAHSNANRAPWYLKNVALLNNEKGIEFSRHCEGCHDPIALISGALTEGAPKKRPYDQDGVTCSTCHSIIKGDTRGTGSYVMGVPAVLVDEDGKPITREVSDTEILTHLDRHSKAVMKDFYRTSEFCASCHKAALPRTLNDYKWQRAIFLYDEWQNSSFAKQSPLPFYTKDTVSTCQTCHMQREPVKTTDYGAKKGQLASHRWLGANTMVPKYYGFDEQATRVVEFLRNSVFNVDIFALEHGEQESAVLDVPEVQAQTGSEKPQALIAPLGLASFKITPGELVTANVVIQNKGTAHSHVPEQRDMYESWVSFTVKDSTGKIIDDSGFIKNNGDLDERAHSFTNRLINPRGGLNGHHEVWDNRVVAYNNTIQSGRSQLVRYSFHMPASGDVTITASIKYRRFNQHFIDFAISKGYQQPIVDMVSQTRTLHVGDNAPTSLSPAEAKLENKEWMRWNNYGIGLLDAQQYAASVAAFQHVQKLRPEYADAFTNQAIVDILWEKYDDARPSLAKALALSPGNARALYYRALVERNEGNLDLAIVDLQAVAKAFPQSRDAHRELGFSYYQQHKYPLARAEYEYVQSIDPDDLSAHYNLSILYRRLGMKDKAAIEAAAFADQKDDPTASTYALEYLRNHNEIANESVTWHVHELDAPAHVAPVVAPTSGNMVGGGSQ